VTTTNKQRGFSLLELTIGAMLTVGLMGAIFALVGRNQQVFLSEVNTTDMNENARTAVDLLTRDVQSAGMGLPRVNGSFAAIFYTDGASGTPDSILMVNGDPYGPDADVNSRAAGSAEFFCVPPSDVKVTGNGSNVQMTYVGANNQVKPIYKSYDTDPRLYICYDDSHAMVFALSQDGMITGSGANAQLKLQHNPSIYWNPPSVFGTTLDTAEPDYPNAKISLLGSLIGYRVNTTTHELERTEDLTNWYAVARGIVDMQVQYRTVTKVNGVVTESVSAAPADRRSIRSVIITLTAETADLPSTSKNYRRTVQQVEITPRNFNLLSNTNLSSNTEATWDF
jgi:Tfp pilus assembly protein PilW